MGPIHQTQTGRGETFSGYTRLEVDVCVTCGVLFAAPKELLDQRREDGDWFHCPNGHQQHFSDRESTRLKRKLEAERERAGRLAAQRDQAEASLRAQKGVTTKLKKRIGAGTCPCCKRTFKQLSRHMESQHPDYPESK